jgi:hypothetical protein
MRSDLSAFCAPAQVGVGDLIKASDTPDGRGPGITRSPGHRRSCSALDATGNDGCSNCVQPHGRPVGRGRAERGVGVEASALLLPLVDNGSAGQRAPRVFDLASGDGGPIGSPAAFTSRPDSRSPTSSRETHRRRPCCCCTRGSNRWLVSTACCRRCHRRSAYSRWISAAMAMLTSRPTDMPW